MMKPHSDIRAVRWATALHEAAHAVIGVGFALEIDPATPLPDELARLGPAGGWAAGFDAVYRGGTPGALATMAGPRAELLADDFPPPPFDAAGPFDALARLEARAYARDPIAYAIATAVGSPADERVVAMWCIAGHEKHPDSWAPRHRWLVGQADALVRDNAAIIVKAATILFRTGHLMAADLRKILGLPEPPPADAGQPPARPARSLEMTELEPLKARIPRAIRDLRIASSEWRELLSAIRAGDTDVAHVHQLADSAGLSGNELSGLVQALAGIPEAALLSKKAPGLTKSWEKLGRDLADTEAKIGRAASEDERQALAERLDALRREQRAMERDYFEAVRAVQFLAAAKDTWGIE